MLRHTALIFCAFAVPSLGVELPMIHPSTGSIHRWIGVPSTLTAFQQVSLHARVAGYVKSVFVDKGDTVKAGQVLAEIEVPELEADKVKAEAEMQVAETDLQRMREARSKSPDLVLPQTVDNAEARYLIAKANLTRCQTLLEFAQIKAPFDGVVAARFIDRGAYVAPAMSPLLKIVDNSKIRCQIPITELETPLAKIGKPVRINVDALTGISFETTIARTSQSLDPATRTMLIEADLDNATGKLYAGMSANAKIGVEIHEHSTLIPAAALVMEKTNAFVYKYLNGKAVKTPVKPGFSDGTSVEIPELLTTDLIIVAGSTPLSDGQEVTQKPSSASK